jgi:hypothetical protein
LQPKPGGGFRILPIIRGIGGGLAPALPILIFPIIEAYGNNLAQYCFDVWQYWTSRAVNIWNKLTGNNLDDRGLLPKPGSLLGKLGSIIDAAYAAAKNGNLSPACLARLRLLIDRMLKYERGVKAVANRLLEIIDKIDRIHSGMHNSALGPAACGLRGSGPYSQFDNELTQLEEIINGQNIEQNINKFITELNGILDGKCLDVLPGPKQPIIDLTPGGATQIGLPFDPNARPVSPGAFPKLDTSAVAPLSYIDNMPVQNYAVAALQGINAGTAPSQGSNPVSRGGDLNVM